MNIIVFDIDDTLLKTKSSVTKVYKDSGKSEVLSTDEYAKDPDIDKKTDETNKLIHHLRKEYDVVYFQDEQISKWKKFNFGRQIQHSYLGRVKAKLVSMEKSGESFKISKWMPTTKFCPNCGALNSISLDERTYKCECGYQFDRDIHAAKNVKLFGSTKRAECLEQASVETLASAALENISKASKLGRRSEKQKIPP